MSFASPFAALLAAAISIPLLVLLYILRLRRRRVTIASTLLWPSVTEELQVNMPFRRLRLTALFALQLAVLLLLLAALSDPAIEAETPAAERLILLVDASASMQAGEPVSRFDRARELARDIVRRHGRGGRRSTSVAIIAVGQRPRLITPFETRTDVLLDWIDRLEPTDEEANLPAALALAETFMRSADDEDLTPPDVVFVSDGGVAPPPDEGGYTVRGGAFRFVQVVETPGPLNIGITDLSARRDLDDPARVLVFARVLQDGAAVANVRLEVDVNGGPPVAQRITVPAATAGGPPGMATVSIGVDAPEGGVINVHLTQKDALPADDTAALVLSPPRPPRLRLIHPEDGPDPYLVRLLEEFEPERLRGQTAAAFAREDPIAIDAGRDDDLLVFDRVSAARLPGIPTLTFGAVPAGIDVVPPASEGGVRVLSWSRDHPLMRHVSLDTIVFAGFGAMQPPRSATILASGPQGAIIISIATREAPHVVVGFSLAQSNWPTHVSVAVFLQNVLNEMTARRAGAAPVVVRPGEPVTVRRAASAPRVRVAGPDFEWSRDADTDGLVTVPGLPRVGLYDLEGVTGDRSQLAVSLLSVVESDLRPRATLRVNAEPVTGRNARTLAPRRLWPWLVLAAFTLLVVEWLVYCGRMRAT